MLKNKNGITVSELKKYIMSFPELNVDGEEYEVWLKSGDGVSSPCTSITILNESDIFMSYQDQLDADLKHEGEVKLKGEWYDYEN